jgi:predicted CXXCH cytochrome family protein
VQRHLSSEKLGFWAGIGWLILTLGCSPENPAVPGGVKPGPGGTTGTSATNLASEFLASLPQVSGPPGYIGSKDCRSCHEDQFASWHRSYHRTMTQVAASESVQAKFQNVVLTNDGNRFTLNRSSNEFRVRMERVTPTPAGETSPEPFETRFGLVTGSHHMQVFWLPGGAGNVQIGFPFTWLIPEKRWVPRNSTFLRPPSLDHRPETWNQVCARCHATGSQPNLDRTARTWHTAVGELGISCEACHGPGQRHAIQQREWQQLSRMPDQQSTNLAIVHPAKIPPARASQICGFCHSMKWWDRNEGWPERGFSFRPGDDLEATTPIIRPKEVEKQPWLRRALENSPDMFRDFFWPDGMIRVSGREYNGLIESPCYKGGQFSCLSCHSLHNSNPADQLARNRTDNRACTQCHESFQSESAMTAHTRHQAGSSGSQCYNCHMPHTTYGVLTAIRSHQVSSPKVADQLATGRPNACSLCHLDKPLAWTANQLTQWFGQPMPKLSADETAVADAVRLALTGDAGQRALLAWHFSWDPAVQVAGKSWIPPILAGLLEDPYAAVRCVAERSLRQVSNLVPADYDFTVAPESRSSVQVSVWERWSREYSAASDQTLPVHTLVQRNDLAAMRERLQRLARQRDEKPVRLRE